ncbi:PilZ domain-containing protein [bacterium]|nr:PilZ domain-containing protein [candidate division CSSED10-310 bacterium]
MASEIKEPENRPKERIEHLISGDHKEKDKRIYDRLSVEPGTEVYFPMVCKGEIVDVSENGISIRFKPADSPGLAEDNTLTLSIPLETHTFKIPGNIKRVESRFGVLVVGMSFDPEMIEIET